MKFRSHLRRQYAEALMRYKHNVNAYTINIFLASMNERRQKCPLSDQTGAFVDKVQMVTVALFI